MKRNFLIYGLVALLTVGAGLWLINAQSQQENAALAAGGATPDAGMSKAMSRTFGSK